MVEGLALGLLAPAEHVRLLSEDAGIMERGFSDYVVIASSDGLIKYSIPAKDFCSGLSS